MLYEYNGVDYLLVPVVSSEFASRVNRRFGWQLSVADPEVFDLLNRTYGDCYLLLTSLKKAVRVHTTEDRWLISDVGGVHELGSSGRARLPRGLLDHVDFSPVDLMRVMSAPPELAAAFAELDSDA